MFDANRIKMPPGVIPLTPVLLTFRRFLLTHTLPDAASATTSFVAGVKSVCGTTTIGAIFWSILGFIIGTTTGRVQLLNNFSSNSPLLVSLTFSFLFLV